MMTLRIAVLKETAPNELRVAATPETVAKYKKIGVEVVVESGAGLGSGISDTAYRDAGAVLETSAESAAKNAGLILCVRRPSAHILRDSKPECIVVGIMDPFGYEGELQALATVGAQVLGMEFLPRITRAQSMDVLSSQANLAGYRAVIEASNAYGKVIPMMMTAAGTIPAAKVFVMGAGVAGLQAIATARRLGAVVTATDVRPAAKEQVESLGAKFIAVQDEEFRAAETSGGYAREMSAEYRAKQAELVSDHIAKQDIVITTALIPGRPAPRLVSAAMVASMKPGSIIVDLAVERGGNVELAQPDTEVEHKGVRILGLANGAGRIAASASMLYARNLFAFISPMLEGAEGILQLNHDDELIKAMLLTHGGRIVHPSLATNA